MRAAQRIVHDMATPPGPGSEIPQPGAAPERDLAPPHERLAPIEANAGPRDGSLDALRAGDETYRQILDESSDPIFMFRPDGRYQYANRAFAVGVGRTAQEVIGKPIWEVFEQAEADRRFAAVQWVFEHGEVRTIEVRVPAPGGDRHYLTTLKPIFGDRDEVVSVLCISKEISDRIRAEEDLREREARLSAIFQMSRDAIGMSKAGVHVLVNPAYAAMFGYEHPEQLLGVSILDVIAPESHGLVLDYLGRRKRGVPIPATYEVVAQRRDGQAFLMEVSGSSVELRGEPHALVILRDVTDQRRAARALVDSEQRYRSLVELAPIGIAVHRDGIIRYANPAALRLVGAASADALVGRALLDVVHPDDQPAVAERVRRALTRGEVMPSREERFLRVDGEVIDVEAQGTQIQYEGGPALQVIFSDITERKRAEATEAALRSQLHESQKMEAIGTLAGGVAHELNNFLAMIIGNVALARQDEAWGAQAELSLAEIDKAALRARDLVQQILTFSRKQPRDATVQPLRPAVEEALRLLRATLPTGVELASRLGGAPLHVSANANQLEQVLMNLCTNAWHALLGRAGRIEVGIETAQVDVERARRLGHVAPGPHARLWVRDTGCGMDAATQARMFEPFFTTKPVGRGTGLGLAVVHGIVAAHGGAIEVESAPGEGTTVAIYLPLREAPVAPRPVEPVAALPRGEGQRVLYVDDEDAMVFLVKRMLDRLGYRTVGCTTASEAIAIAGATSEALDVVVTDFNMPGHSGLDLARSLREIRPDLPVIITSGYVTEELRAEAALAGVSQVIDKQASVDALCETIHRLLSSAPKRRASTRPPTHA